ncbi:VOC family protein [Nonomuraea dietziae]|uniref:VOC family protein n=1 Tax=Nonomuraea dietziae TaxID=65515 RepID=UPI003F4DD039
MAEARSDVAREEERLRGAGVTLLREARLEPWALTELWIADPDGNRIVPSHRLGAGPARPSLAPRPALTRKLQCSYRPRGRLHRYNWDNSARPTTSSRPLECSSPHDRWCPHFGVNPDFHFRRSAATRKFKPFAHCAPNR